MARPGAGGQLRIIGGNWRGRRLQFPGVTGLRPTSDRTRETLFNWLGPHVAQARCLDLFAGSGALGLEALSRGAAYCDFVEASRKAARRISEHLALLDASERGACHTCEAAQFMRRADSRYDIVFLDPPFDRAFAEPTCHALDELGLLATGAYVYLETGQSEEPPALPDRWSLHRGKSAGAVRYQLYEIT